MQNQKKYFDRLMKKFLVEFSLSSRLVSLLLKNLFFRILFYDLFAAFCEVIFFFVLVIDKKMKQTKKIF